MKNKRYIYCEYEFWEDFFKLEKQNDFMCNRAKRRLWDNFYDFLERGILFFDKSKNEIDFNTPGGIALQEMIQKRGGANVSFIPDRFPSVDDIHNDDDAYLNAVFLKCISQKSCTKISRDFGIIVFNLDMVFSAEHVYKNNGTPFTRNNGVNWSYMMELKDKCPSISYSNSMIIVDRYLLADGKENVFNNNLKPIFEAMLPNKLANGIRFNISIFADTSNIYDTKIDKIKNLLNEIRPSLDYSINIYNSKRLHDRSILTNNVLLTSGVGFDIINNEDKAGRFTTSTLLFPFLQSNNADDDTYINWIDNVLREKGKCRTYKEDYWGDNINTHHILNFYYEKPNTTRSTFSQRHDNVSVHFHGVSKT